MNGLGGFIFENRLIAHLGKISYCFYGFQFRVLTLLMVMIPDYQERGAIFLGYGLLGLLAVSSFFYHVLEEPARKYVSIRLRARSRPIASSVT